MKKGILVFICCLNFVFVASQQLSRDSLYQLVKNMPEDTTKIETYFQFGMYLESTSFDSAIFYYTKAKLIADKYNNVKGKIRYASIYSGILNEQGKLAESYRLSLESLKLTQQYHLYFEMAKTCNNLGNVLNYMGEFDSSMIYFLRAVNIFERINRKEHLNVIYGNIGTIYLSMGNFEKSIEYTQKSVELSKENNDSAGIASALTNLAGAFISVHKYKEAFNALNNCLDISGKIQNRYTENLAYLGLGNLYTQTEEYTKAIDVLLKAVSTAREMNYTNNLANGLNAIAFVYVEMKDYQRANNYATEAVLINEKYNVYNNLHQQYKLISDIRFQLGQFSSAYTYLFKYVSLNDSLSIIEAKRNLDELEKKYQTVQKDKQIFEKNLKLAENKIEFEQKEKRIQKINLWLILAFAIILSLILILMLVYFVSSQKQKMHSQQLIALEREKEVIRLKATLDGQLQERQRIAREIHDEIGSGLTTISFLSNDLGSDNKKAKKIMETSQTLILQMNEIIWSMNAENDQLEDLVAFIRHNAGEMLDAVNIEYTFDIPEMVPSVCIAGMQRRNIYLVIKEVLHNTIKHSGATLVTMKMDFTDGVSIFISDNGRGISDDLTNPFGNGMKNIEFRMKQIGGEWEIISKKPLILRFFLGKGNMM